MNNEPANTFNSNTDQTIVNPAQSIFSPVQTTVNGSTSGTVICSQPINQVDLSKIVLYLNNLTGTATFTFPVPMAYTPVIMSTNSLPATTVTTVSNTSVTVTGSNTTGFIFLQGF